MYFPLNVFVAIIISAIHLFISFNINLTYKYKRLFRQYSVIINALFIVFLIAFSIFFMVSQSNEGIGILFNGLATLYVLLFVPLATALIWVFVKWIMHLSSYSSLTKFTVIVGPVILIIALVVVGYTPFMLSFYGFA